LDRYFEQAGHAEEIRRDSEGDFSARRLTGIAVIHSIAAAMDPTKKVTMSLFRVIRRGGFLVSNALLIFAATSALAASAPMSPAELALYQRADREKILIEGAKKEGQFTLYDSHTWFRTIAREFEKKYPFIKVSESVVSQR
jgi:hypothetical protein